MNTNTTSNTLKLADVRRAVALIAQYEKQTGYQVEIHNDLLTLEEKCATPVLTFRSSHCLQSTQTEGNLINE